VNSNIFYNMKKQFSHTANILSYSLLLMIGFSLPLDSDAQVTPPGTSVPRSAILSTLQKGLNVQYFIGKFGHPMDQYTNKIGQTALSYAYYPPETKPVKVDGAIPGGIMLIFENDKLTTWREWYGYKR
jgi:hypothetical protein